MSDDDFFYVIIISLCVIIIIGTSAPQAAPNQKITNQVESSMQNILWYAYYDSLTAGTKPINEIMDDLVDLKFTGLAYFVGGWMPDGTLRYHSTEATEITQGNAIITAAHAKGLEVYGSVFAAWWLPTCPDLTSSTVRAQMATEITDLIGNLPYDGIIDDIEDYQVSPTSHAVWTQLMGQTLHGLGKKAAVYYFIQNCPPYIHKTYLPLIDADLTDFVVIRFNPNSTTTLRNTAILYQDILDYYPSDAKWMAQIHLAGGTDYTEPETIQDSIDFYNNLYGSGFASSFEGFTVWQHWMLTGTELVKWINWDLKNYDEPEPEEPEPPIPPPPESYYYVQTSTDGHGTVNGSTGWQYRIPVGTPYVLTASPATDYKFDYWTRNLFIVNGNPYTINNGIKDTTYNMMAYFVADVPVEPDEPDPPAPAYYSVNIGTSTGVTTDLTGTQTLEVSQPLTVVATLKNNYKFNYWLYDGTPVQHGNLTFTKTESSTGTHTLLPVVQQVIAHPDTPISLPSTNVAPLAPNKMLSQIIKKQQPTLKAINLDKLIRKLKM